jgi:hypothetical protein
VVSVFKLEDDVAVAAPRAAQRATAVVPAIAKPATRKALAPARSSEAEEWETF